LISVVLAAGVMQEVKTGDKSNLTVTIVVVCVTVVGFLIIVSIIVFIIISIKRGQYGPDGENIFYTVIIIYANGVCEINTDSQYLTIGTAHIVCGRVYVRCPSVCPSVCLSHHLTAAAACGGFAAERRAGRKYRSTTAGSNAAAARRRSTALSSQCG